MTNPYDDEPGRWEDHDDYGDDLSGPPKEEPDCYACNDGGCSSCHPTRLQAWRQDVGFWFRFRYDRRRARGRTDEECPF